MANSPSLSKTHVILLVFGCYLIFNYNKKCLTFQYTHLIREFGLSQQNAGSISSAQQFSILVVTFFGGILTDYVSSSLLFSSGLILCGLTTLLFPLGSSTFYFAFVWALNGIGQGLSLPTAMRLTKEFSNTENFATNWSFVLTSVNIAGMLNPLGSAFLSSTFGWQIAIYLSGLITLATGLVVLVLLNKSTAQTSTSKENKATKSKPSSHIRMRDLFAFPVLWVLMANRFAVSLHRLSVSDWTQVYFSSEKHLGEYMGSLYVTTFECASVFGKLLSGRINDYFMGKYLSQLHSPLAVRLPISIVFHSVAALSLFLYLNLLDSSSSLASMLCVATLAGIFSSGNVITLSVLSTEISAKEHEGFVTSLCNLAVKVGAFCSGYPFTLIAFLADWYTSYSVILVLTIGIVLLNVGFYKRSTKYKIE